MSTDQRAAEVNAKEAERAVAAAEAAKQASRDACDKLQAADNASYDKMLRFREELAAASGQVEAAEEELRKQDYAEAKEKAESAITALRGLQTLALPVKTVDELANARAVAKEWVAANTALFGLFSISGIVFADDVFDDLGDFASVAIPLLALLAVFAGAWSILYGTKAAHGWPQKSRERKWDRIPLIWTKNYQRRPKTPTEALDSAVADLERAVWGAGFALFFLVAALGVLWHDKASPAATSEVEVRVTEQQGGAEAVCGELHRITEDSLVVQDAEGNQEPYRLTDYNFAIEACGDE